MKELIDKLYDETYSPKLTPEILLSNLNLPNYTNITFEKKEGCVIATTHCILENGNEATYRYYFQADLLTILESSIEGKTEIIYNREIEKQKLVTRIKGIEKHIKKNYA